MLEEGAEDFGLDFGPVVGGGLAQEDKFEVLDFQTGGLGEETAVEIADAFEPSAGGLVFMASNKPPRRS
jgi:radical SAM superfamily enzyme YgiQ (UPF0313 family)